ncbi:ABC transporter substrate-binding protein [Thalassobacillus sp. B23F22_16]|uniref:ABC transporter substrate-binding protein n=1 Tax=Thalassobacillus sp. B23F22_16 TaxID=3459513 RepID=UPI00373E9D4B
MKKWVGFLLMMVVVLGLAACSDTEAQGDADVYKIGAIYSKTGAGSPLGEPEWNATKLLEKKINEEGGIDGKKVEIVLADDESTPEKAMEEMNRMIHDENVVAVLGSTTSGASLAMKGIAMDNEVPLVSAGAAVSIISPVEEAKWVFKTPHSDAHAVERIYMHLQNEGMNKIAILADSNAFGESGVEQLEALAGDYGMEIVIKESYNTDDPDMKTQLTKIDSSGAEAMIVWGTNPGPAIIAKNSKELGLDIPYIGSHGIANQSFIDLAGEAAEGVTIPTGKLLFPTQIPEDDEQYEVISSFYDDYMSEYDSAPTNFGSYGYDNLMLIVDALESGATDRESIREYLENDVQGYVGATGIFTFSADDHNGLEADSMVLAEVSAGEWTLKE